MTAIDAKWHSARERSIAQGLSYPCADLPAPGELREVQAGVFWLRVALPFALDHINLWLLADGQGWTLVDTGVFNDDTVALWTRLLEDWPLPGPIQRIIATHMHVDHVGMAGWLCARLGCQLWMPREEYLHARLTVAEAGAELHANYRTFYQRAGWDAAAIDRHAEHYRHYGRQFSPLPDSYRRLHDGERITIGGHQWRVLLTGGHSPEHASLYCPEQKLYLSGDQVLPRISSNVSVHGYEPDANPLDDWYSALGRIALQVPDDVLVLPAHNECFHGLHERVQKLRAEVAEGLAALLDRLRTPVRVVDVFEVLFHRPIEPASAAQYRLATGEALAHLNLLRQRGDIDCQLDEHGTAWYRHIP